MAAFAVARVFDPALVDEKIYVLDVPRIPESVGVRRLPPLRVNLLMTVPAILGRGKALGIDELARVGACLRRQERLVLRERHVVMARDILRVLRALRSR